MSILPLHMVYVWPLGGKNVKPRVPVGSRNGVTINSRLGKKQTKMNGCFMVHFPEIKKPL